MIDFDDRNNAVVKYTIIVLNFAICFYILSGIMYPLYWNDNEIHYFDLSYRMVQPEYFNDNNSIFDFSNARFVSYWLIGTAIDHIGYEQAKVFFGLLCLTLYAFVLSILAASLRFGPVAMAIVLAVFLGQQSLVGEEWIFGTTEAKVFAYICIIAAISAALFDRWIAAIILAAIGTAFHFLVGGFWGAAIIALYVITKREWWITARLSGLFILLISPLLALLVGERLASEVDLSGVDLSLAEIYAVYRHAHHVAPFADGMRGFAVDFFPGLLMHLCLALAFFAMRKDFGKLTPLILWVAALNAYFLLAFAVLFLDRNTHILAPLYVLRPSGLVLFLSIMLIVGRVVAIIPTDLVPRLTIPTLLVVAGIALPDIALRMTRLALAGPVEQRVEAQMTQDERDVLAWLGKNTKKTDLVLVQPDVNSDLFWEGRSFPAALERLTPASYYVNFKFVPTTPADLAEWYRRLKKRSKIFEGDCDLLNEIAVNYLVMHRQELSGQLDACTQEVYKNASYVLFRARL